MAYHPSRNIINAQWLVLSLCWRSITFLVCLGHLHHACQLVLEYWKFTSDSNMWSFYIPYSHSMALIFDDIHVFWNNAWNQLANATLLEYCFHNVHSNICNLHIRSKTIGYAITAISAWHWHRWCLWRTRTMKFDSI